MTLIRFWRFVKAISERTSCSSCSEEGPEVAAVAMHGTPVCAGVVITGGAAGVGYAYADEFLARGHQAGDSKGCCLMFTMRVAHNMALVPLFGCLTGIQQKLTLTKPQLAAGLLKRTQFGHFPKV